MTLSPNAQEFIPIAYSIPSVQTFVLDPSTGTTSPVIISHIPFGYASSPYYAPSQIMVPRQVFYHYPSNLSAPVQATQSLNVPHEPYIADQKMYKKVFNNVNLIKQTIECHYNIQNQPGCLTPKNSMVPGRSSGKISIKNMNHNIRQEVGFKLNIGDFPQLGFSGNAEQASSK
ncbi:hypothetical protein BpHYR1_040408 [Brachionus plicatilis]|uniref:Uncharacterized protein n=1 Tax=Brachionus plicatilis TaxID=10195 RepID=A0A3M7P7A4_BRAPC|nr:hypothetical protein BpHYR1_040408 [Brachionus plicatilis]